MTRDVTSKKRTKFRDILCDNCKSKKNNYFCIECKRIYKCATSKTHRNLIKSRQSIGQSDQTLISKNNLINQCQMIQLFLRLIKELIVILKENLYIMM